MEIERLLEKINVIESWDAKPSVGDRSSHFQEFVAWMADNGADVGGVEIAKFPDYDYGLKAMKDFSEGDLLIAVPRKLMITVENVKHSVLGNYLTMNYGVVGPIPRSLKTTLRVVVNAVGLRVKSNCISD